MNSKLLYVRKYGKVLCAILTLFLFACGSEDKSLENDALAEANEARVSEFSAKATLEAGQPESPESLLPLVNDPSKVFNQSFEDIGRVLIGGTLVNEHNNFVFNDKDSTASSTIPEVPKFEMHSHVVSLHLTPKYYGYCTSETGEDPGQTGCNERWLVFIDLNQDGQYSVDEMILDKTEAATISYQVHVLDPSAGLQEYESNSFAIPFRSPVAIPYGQELDFKIAMIWYQSGQFASSFTWGDVFAGKIILNKFEPEERHSDELQGVNERIAQKGGEQVNSLDWGHDILKAHKMSEHASTSRQGFSPINQDISGDFQALDYHQHEQEEDAETLRQFEADLEQTIAHYDGLEQVAHNTYGAEIQRLKDRINDLEDELKACGAWLAPLAVPVLRWSFPFLSSSAIRCVQSKQQEISISKYEIKTQQKLLDDRLKEINAERAIKEEEMHAWIRGQNDHIELRHTLSVLHKKAYQEVSAFINTEETRRVQNLNAVAAKYQSDISADLKQIREYEEKVRKLESFSYVTKALKDTVMNEIRLIPNFVNSVTQLEQEIEKIEEFYHDVEDAVSSGNFNGIIEDLDNAVGLPMFESIRKLGLTDFEGRKTDKLKKETAEALMRNSFNSLANIDGLFSQGDYVDYYDYVDPTSDWFNRVKNNIAFMLSGFDTDLDDSVTFGNGNQGTVFPLSETYEDVYGPHYYNGISGDPDPDFINLYDPELISWYSNTTYDISSYEICRVAKNRSRVDKYGRTETSSNIEVGYVYTLKGQRYCASIINKNLAYDSFEVLIVSNDYEWASPNDGVSSSKKPVRITTDNNGNGVWGEGAINSHVCRSAFYENLGFEHEHQCVMSSFDSSGSVRWLRESHDPVAYGEMVHFLYASEYTWEEENPKRETRNQLKERNAYFTNHTSEDVTVHNYHKKTRRLQAREMAYNFFTHVFRDNYHIINGVDYGKDNLTRKLLIYMEQSLGYFAINRPIEVPSLFLDGKPSVMVFTDPSNDSDPSGDALILFNQDYDYESAVMRFSFFLEELGHMTNWFRCKINNINRINEHCFNSGDEGARFKDALYGYDMTQDAYLKSPLADDYSVKSLNEQLANFREGTLTQNRETYSDYIQGLSNYPDDKTFQTKVSDNTSVYVKAYNKNDHYGDNLLGGDKATLMAIMQAGAEIPSEIRTLADKYALQFIYFAPKLMRNKYPYEFYDPSADNLTEDDREETKKNVPTYILHFSVHDEMNVVTNRSEKIRNKTKGGLGAAGIWIRNHGAEVPVQNGRVIDSEVHYIKEIIFRLELDINLVGAFCQASSKMCNTENFDNKGLKSLAGVTKYLGKFGQTTVGLEIGFVLKAKGDLWKELLAIDMGTAIAGAIAGAIVGIVTGTDPVTWGEFGSLLVESIATAGEIAGYRNNPDFTSLMFTSVQVSLPFDFNVLTSRKPRTASYKDFSRSPSVWTVDTDGQASPVSSYENLPGEERSSVGLSGKRQRAFRKVRDNFTGANALLTLYPRYSYTLYHHNFKDGSVPSDHDIDRD